MSKAQNNYYIANKYTKDIVYPYGNGEEDRYRKTEEGVLLIHKNENGGVTERLLSEDEFSLSEFDRIKAISDEDYREQNRKDMIERRNTVSMASLDESSAFARVSSAEDVFFKTYKNRFDCRTIENALIIMEKCLSETQKRRLKLYYLSGYSMIKIAKIEGTYKNAVRKSIRNAEKKIKKFLKENPEMGVQNASKMYISEGANKSHQN